MQVSPAWQTDDLADEWIEEEEEEEIEELTETRGDEDTNGVGGAQSEALIDLGNGSCRFGTVNRLDTSVVEQEETRTGGTFVVRAELPPPVLPQTPGIKKSGMKNMFSPLQLERMFEPPSPPKPSSQQAATVGSPPVPFQRRIASRPVHPSKLSQVIQAPSITEDETEAETEAGDGDSDVLDVSALSEENKENIFSTGGARSACEFTFKVPMKTIVEANESADDQATMPSRPYGDYTLPVLKPIPLPIPNDPRLRLFQLQYDTYTRDHLSAIVDSFVISSPSNGSSSNNSQSTMLASTPNSRAGSDELKASQRATKRLKLTPPAELPAVFSPPRVQPIRPPFRRDYVGESQAFMQQIKQARDFSLISMGNATEFEHAPPTPQAQRGFEMSPPSPVAGSSRNNQTMPNSRYSSMAYRRQAADLMAKIKGDRRRASDRSDSSLSSSRPASPDRSMAPSPPSMRPSSPVKRRLIAKDEDSDPDPDPDPPSYAASVGRSFADVDLGNRNEGQANAFNQRTARPRIQPPVVMPVVVPNSPSPISADRVRSPNPAFLAPSNAFGSGHFPNHMRTESTQADLNRLVSVGSTLTNGTMLTAGSVGSGVKHAGPAQIVRIQPGDLPTLPERVGNMVFDRSLGRWIKERGVSRMTVTPSSMRMSPHGSPANTEGSAESDDPFRDIESVREGESSRSVAAQDVSGYTIGDLVPDANRSGGTEEMELVNSDEASFSLLDIQEKSLDVKEKSMDLYDKSYASSFSFDQPSAGVIDFLTGEEDQSGEVQDDITTDSDDDDLREAAPVPIDEEEEFIENFASMSVHQVRMQNGAELSFSMSMETSAILQDELAEPAIATPRPAGERFIQPPRSALKSASVTPISRPGQGRSVSFSDGRQDGKIKGLHSESEDSTNKGPAILSAKSIQSMPSLRSKRIADMLGDLEESLLEVDEEPMLAQGSTRPITNVAIPVQQTTGSPNGSTVSQRPFTRSQTIRPPGHSSPRRGNTSSRANATFLTECSFGVAHDRLVQVITDVQPFEPYWESLTSVDLSNRKLDSVARLKEFLPNLDTLNLNNNLLPWLSGIPGSVRTLTVSSNALSALTSFAHLQHIEVLDVSNNDIDSLQSLSCLRHLRELRADNNKISKLDGIAQTNGLVKLSLEGNDFQVANFSSCRWQRLELLNLSNNRLDEVQGLRKLSSLASLNLDNNLLCALDERQDSSSRARRSSTDASVLPRLRVLRISGNRLKHLDAARFPNLRTLYVDNNFLADTKSSNREKGTPAPQPRLTKLDRLGKLENFSARNQNGPGARESSLCLESRDIRDVKRLYLSGNPSPLPLSSLTEACYNLVYLELAACRLTTLPGNLSQLMPNVRALNLNYNFLEADELARSLVGLSRLTKLTVVGNRLSGTKPLIKMLNAMGSNIEMLDFRMNPCTLGWYLPLLVQGKDDGALLQPSEPSRGQNSSPFLTTSATIGNRPPLPAGSDVSSDGQHLDAEAGSEAPEGFSQPAKKSKRGPSHWETLDAQYRRGLPDKSYAGRLAYRGLVMRACPQIKMLDDVRVTEKEKKKAEGLLRRVLEDVEASNATIKPDGRK